MNSVACKKFSGGITFSQMPNINLRSGLLTILSEQGILLFTIPWAWPFGVTTLLPDSPALANSKLYLPFPEAQGLHSVAETPHWKKLLWCTLFTVFLLSSYEPHNIFLSMSEVHWKRCLDYLILRSKFPLNSAHCTNCGSPYSFILPATPTLGSGSLCQGLDLCEHQILDEKKCEKLWVYESLYFVVVVLSIFLFYLFIF